MTFAALVEAVKKVRLQELRASSDNYFEVVVKKADLPEIEVLFSSHFGTPFKPAGVSSSKDAHRISEPFGGIRPNQTMYLRRDKEGDSIAFFWPWGCGTQVTVKVILVRSPSLPKKQSFWQRLMGK